MTFREQAEALRHAKLVGGFEGAGFVNALFMPQGSTLIMIDTIARGLFGWQWGYAQYLHTRLVYVLLLQTEKASQRHEIAARVGSLLRLEWHGGASAVCDGIRNHSVVNDSALMVFEKPAVGVQPVCLAPANLLPMNNNASGMNASVEQEPRLKIIQGNGCRCRYTVSGTAPARSQHTELFHLRPV
jgi:hypothetical protein